MRDSVLASNYRPIFQPRGNMMREIAIDSRDYIHIFRDPCNRPKEVDSGFERAGEETGAGEEEVPDRGGLEIKH
jgi:hypothetical protein